MIQIKAVFLETLAKLMGTPQPQIELAKILKSLVLREVEVLTPSKAGTGSVYEHPVKANIDYNNPITTIYKDTEGYWRFNFGCKNGEVGEYKETGLKYEAVSINPAESKVAKIIVNSDPGHISGLKFVDQTGKCVLLAGQHNKANN